MIVAATAVMMLFVIERAVPDNPRMRLAPRLFTCSRTFSTM